MHPKGPPQGKLYKCQYITFRVEMLKKGVASRSRVRVRVRLGFGLGCNALFRVEMQRPLLTFKNHPVHTSPISLPPPDLSPCAATGHAVSAARVHEQSKTKDAPPAVHPHSRRTDAQSVLRRREMLSAASSAVAKQPRNTFLPRMVILAS